MPVDNIKLAQSSKDQLNKVKRVTGIENWNILCRWAFCLSLRDKSIPPPVEIHLDSNVEMSWNVFGGEYADIYWILLKERCYQDGLPIDDDTLSKQFKLHLQRGITFLANNPDINSLNDLLKLVIYS